MSPRTAVIGAALLAAAPLLAAPAAAAATTAATTTPVAARWQKHELSFDYHGFTSYYTCEGLQDKVKQILLLFGARPGARVDATGCPTPNTPSATAWVKLQFESLGNSGTNGGADSVAASWQPVELRPNRPFSMGQGECEIVEKLKPVLTAGFDLQDLEYRTRCVPHQIGINDYSVRGKVLQPVQK